MSKSNPRVQNPATKFIEFKGSKGKFFFWDKEKEQQIEISMPFYFVVLDELSTIKGFNEKNNCGIYSNEIRSLKDDILNVKSFESGIKIVGKYQDIKDSAFREGGKFCKSIYAMLITGKDKYELVNFQLHGSAFSGWMDKKFNAEQYACGVKECKEEKKGTNSYLVPVFEKFKLTTEINNLAIEMDKKLQVYLANYLNQKIEEEATEVVEQEDQSYNALPEGDIKPIANFKEDTEIIDDLPY